MNETDRAVVFVSDSDFLLPTLVAASQAVKQLREPRIADVFVILLDVALNEREIVHRFADDLGIKVVVAGAVMLPAGTHFNKTHVPPATLSIAN
jgi:hypothetical protein